MLLKLEGMFLSAVVKEADYKLSMDEGDLSERSARTDRPFS